MRQAVNITVLVVLATLAIFLGYAIGVSTKQPVLGLALSLGLYVAVVVGWIFWYRARLR